MGKYEINIDSLAIKFPLPMDKSSLIIFSIIWFMKQ